MFRNMKIGMRLAWGFGMLVVLLLTVLGIGIMKLADLNAALDEVARDKWPKTVMANNVIDETNAIAISLRNMLLVRTKEEQQQQLERIMASRKVIAENLETLKKVVKLPRAKELLQQI